MQVSVWILILCYCTVSMKASVDDNLAYKKPAYQKETYANHGASLAVNGILAFDGDTDTEYSETPKGYHWNNKEQWWIVDLEKVCSIKEIYLYNRHDIKQLVRLNRVYLYFNTDLNFVPTEGQLVDTSSWSEAVYTTERQSYGYVGVIKLHHPQNARFVLITVKSPEGIVSLKEVKIYDKPRTDLAEVGTVMAGPPELSLLHPLPYDLLNTDQGGFWEISWDKAIVFEFCQVTHDGGWLKGMKYSYAYYDKPYQLCMISTQETERNTIVCQHSITPVITKFRVEYSDPDQMNRNVRLTGVSIFVADAPLANTIPARILSQGYDSLNLQFDTFINEPYIYNAFQHSEIDFVVCNNQTRTGRQCKNIGPNTSFGWTDLSPGANYSFELTCGSGGVVLPGPIRLITASTKSCQAPFYKISVPRQTVYDSKRKMKVGFQITDVVPNCVSINRTQFLLDGKKILDEYFLKQLTHVQDEIKAVTTYNFTVILTNSDGQKTIKSEIFKTGELAPGEPGNFTVSGKSAFCVILDWQKPRQPNGEITAYEFKRNSSDWERIELPSYQHTVCNLTGGERVVYLLRAVNSADVGDTVTAEGTTQPCPTLLAPEFDRKSQITLVKNYAKVRIIVTLKDDNRYCGPVNYTATAIQGNYNVEGVTKSSSSIRIEGLAPDQDTYLSVTISDGVNQSTTSEHFKTPRIAPRDAPVIEGSFTNTSCITLIIQAPSHPNGPILSYRASCQTPAEKEVTVSASSNMSGCNKVLVCDLNSGVKVTCTAVAVNSAGPSPVSNQHTDFTDVEAASSCQLEILTKGRNLTQVLPEISVHFLPVELRGDYNISSYQVIVIPAQSADSDERCHTDCMYGLGKNMKTKEDCYIAAEFLPEKISGRGISFHVGDGKRYNEYFNQILSEGESYEVLLAVEWEPEYGHKKVTVLQAVKGKALRPTPDVTTEGSTVMIIVSVSGGAAVIILITVIVVIFRRRKAPSSREPSYEGQNNNCYEHPDGDMELDPHPYRVIEDQTTRDGYEVPVPTQPQQRALPTLPAHEDNDGEYLTIIQGSGNEKYRISSGYIDMRS